MLSEIGPVVAADTQSLGDGALSFGAVVLVRFPFTSQAASKQRPAVIV